MQTQKPLAGLTPAALGASLAMAMLGSPSLALAQAPTGAAPATTGGEAGAIRLPEISVGGTAPASPTNPLQGTTGLSRLDGPIQDLPQSVQVVPREILQQQNVTSLEQALRNVPGITSTVGEGGGGLQGDQLRIRGFNAQNDLYVDGLKDFGAYSRDAFNFENVAVFFGPAGVTFGAGAVGGAVNITTRTPFLGTSNTAEASGGSGSFFRGTADVNQQIGESSAVRIQLMGQNRSAIIGRDGQQGTRWGIAPSVSWGLGTDLTLTLQYMHYEYNQTTDAGVPVLTQPGARVGQPATEYGLRRANWYGAQNDRDKVQLDRFTARLQWRATDWLTVTNDTRASIMDRDFAYTIIACDATCTNNFFNRRGQAANYTVSAASAPYWQYTMGLQNITTAVARFNTGSLRHEATAGFDVWYEGTDRNNAMYNPARPGGNLWAPDQSGISYPTSPGTAVNSNRNIGTTTLSLFASDRIWLLPQLSVVGGLRWSTFQTDYSAWGTGQPITSLASNVNALDPRAALVYEPTPDRNYYFSYSTSSSPPGNNFVVLPGQATFNNTQLQPERNTIFELGTKWSVLDEKLGLTAALFRIIKDNATTTDPLTGSSVATGDVQRNQGLELGAVGRVTAPWLVSARYTLNSSTILTAGTPATALSVGNRVQFVPQNAVAVWSTYDLFPGESRNLTLGGGVTWRSQVFLNNANTQSAPANLSFDAMVSHTIAPGWRAQLNAYNLGNALNYDVLFNNRVTPSAGRTFVLALAGTF